MRSVEFTSFGAARDVLRVRADAPPPGAPAAGEVVIAVVASSVNPKDCFVRKGRFRALSGSAFPQRCGYDFAGVVVARGSCVDDQLACGARCRASRAAPCGTADLPLSPDKNTLFA